LNEDDELEPSFPLEPGDELGPYRLVRSIGTGGMAEVWLARRPLGESTRGQFVVLKTVLTSMAGEERYRRMFRNEVELSSLLTHANIVKVLGDGHAHGRAYLVMEWIDGTNLERIRDALSHEPIEIRCQIAAYIVGQILHALRYAHTLVDETGKPLGVVHRDVTPHNVLVSNSGDVKLADFGIAHFANDESSDAHVKGKLRYMAPEHLAGQSHAPGVDLFAVGALLQELIEGVKFRSDVADDRVMHSRILGGRLPPFQLRIDSDLEALRRGLLEPTEKARISTALEALDRLDQWPAYRDMKLPLSRLACSITGAKAPRTGFEYHPKRKLAARPLASPPERAVPHGPDLAPPQQTGPAGTEVLSPSQFLPKAAGVAPPLASAHALDADEIVPGYAHMHDFIEVRPSTASMPPRDPDAPDRRSKPHRAAPPSVVSPTDRLPEPPIPLPPVPLSAADENPPLSTPTPAMFDYAVVDRLVPVRHARTVPAPRTQVHPPPALHGSPHEAPTRPEHREVTFQYPSENLDGTRTRFLVTSPRRTTGLLAGALTAVFLGGSIAVWLAVESFDVDEPVPQATVAATVPSPASEPPADVATEPDGPTIPLVRDVPQPAHAADPTELPARQETPPAEPEISPPATSSEPTTSSESPAPPKPPKLETKAPRREKKPPSAPVPTAFTGIFAVNVKGYTSVEIRVGSARLIANPRYTGRIPAGRHRVRWLPAGETKWRTLPAREFEAKENYWIRIDPSGMQIAGESGSTP